MTIALTFPGQGSQAVGMGKALADNFAEARAVFDEVDAALGEKLSTVIWDGPIETLTLTANAQPALMAVSLAALRVLEAQGFAVSKAAYVAGHSLGEYSALAAAGSLSISDAARLLRIRGTAMQQAVPVGEGAMAALLGLDFETAQAVANEAAQGDVCEAANDNGPGQVVISGAKAAVERALDIAKAKGAKRALLLPVSAPFHCRLMQPAADVMAEALAKVTINAPVVPLVANVLAAPISDPAEIRAPPRRAGDRHGALARVDQLARGQWQRPVCRNRRRQGAVGACQAHCARGTDAECRHARRRGRGDRASRLSAGRFAAKLTDEQGNQKEVVMFDLTGKRALVTGASGGIGRAIAQALHKQGATVAISGTRREALEALATELGTNVHVLPCNLSVAEEVETLVPRAEEAMGELDLLINNAGITRDMLFARLSDEAWQEVLDVNLTSAFRLTRAALRGMMRRRYGRIISITSIVAVTGNAGQGNYTASKAALIAMSKSLAQEVASRNITVNCVAPGFIETAMTDALNEKIRTALLERVPAKRLGSADDIASAVVYLASEEASYVTGQTLHVNGGMAMI